MPASTRPASTAPDEEEEEEEEGSGGVVFVADDLAPAGRQGRTASTLLREVRRIGPSGASAAAAAGAGAGSSGSTAAAGAAAGPTTAGAAHTAASDELPVSTAPPELAAAVGGAAAGLPAGAAPTAEAEGAGGATPATPAFRSAALQRLAQVGACSGCVCAACAWPCWAGQADDVPAPLPAPPQIFTGGRQGGASAGAAPFEPPPSPLALARELDSEESPAGTPADAVLSPVRRYIAHQRGKQQARRQRRAAAAAAAGREPEPPTPLPSSAAGLAGGPPGWAGPRCSALSAACYSHLDACWPSCHHALRIKPPLPLALTHGAFPTPRPGSLLGSLVAPSFMAGAGGRPEAGARLPAAYAAPDLMREAVDAELQEAAAEHGGCRAAWMDGWVGSGWMQAARRQHPAPGAPPRPAVLPAALSP